MSRENISIIAPRPPHHEFHPHGVDDLVSTSLRRSSARKNVTVACQTCRERRTKCDGDRPCCSRCVRTGSECNYSQDLDGRSTAAIKRKYDEIQQDQDLLNELLDAIRGGSDDSVSQIIALIRSDVPLQELKAAVGLRLIEIKSSGRIPTPEVDRLRIRVENMHGVYRLRPSKRDVLQIHRLADFPLYHVPALPWTGTTEDTDLIANLISVWVTWDKPWNNWIDHDRFVEDMQRGKLDSLYCSPFLVCSILGYVCPYSDYSEAKSKRGATSPLMKSFIEEAKNFMDTEIAKGPSVTAVQGMMYLSLGVSSCGQDRLGYAYMLQAVDMARELEKAPLPDSVRHDEKNAEKLSRVIDTTCWGIYNLSTAAHAAYMRPQMARPPKREKPLIPNQHGRQEIWMPYPRSDDMIPCHAGELMDVHCDVAIYEAEMTRLLFDHDTREGFSRHQIEIKLVKLCETIETRLEAMPDFLKVAPQAPAPVYMHNVWFECLRMRVFTFLLQPHKDACARVQKDAQQKCVKAALGVVQICQMHMEYYTSAPMNNLFAYGTSMALYALFRASRNAQYTTEIMELLVCLRSVSRRWPMAMAMLRMIQIDTRHSEIVLSHEAEKLLDDFEKDDWIHRETRTYRSMWPVSDAVKRCEVTMNDMGKFLDEAEQQSEAKLYNDTNEAHYLGIVPRERPPALSDVSSGENFEMD